jgi:hypothetical protein
MHIEQFDELIEDLGFVFFTSPRVATAQLGQHFPFGLSIHGGVHFWVTPLLRQPINSPLITPSASVTFFLSQFGHTAAPLNSWQRDVDVVEFRRLRRICIGDGDLVAIRHRTCKRRERHPDVADQVRAELRGIGAPG